MQSQVNCCTDSLSQSPQVASAALEQQGALQAPLQARLDAAEQRAAQLQARVELLDSQQACAAAVLDEAKAAQREASEQRRLVAEARAALVAERTAAAEVWCATVMMGGVARDACIYKPSPSRQRQQPEHPPWSLRS